MDDFKELPLYRSYLGWIKILGKRLFFPGLDIHARSRYRFLPQFFIPGSIDTLDAGCGNGALGYAAYKLGNRVLGITGDVSQVERNRIFFSAINADSKRLSFEVLNLYNLPRLNLKFDQIICSETLEHIKDDRAIIGYFYDILRPKGVLHLCCPFALHPKNNLGRIDLPENGGHVRDGYTIRSLKELLEPRGFQIVKTAGLGSPLIVKLDNFLRFIRNTAGDLLALPFFLPMWPFLKLDYLNPSVPLSLYMKAVKVELVENRKVG